MNTVPPRPRDPHHLVGHQPRVGHVLEHVARSSRRRARRHGTAAHAAADHGARTRSAEAGQLADVGVEREVRRTGSLERGAEVARAAADVEHQRRRQVGVLLELGDGVLGQRGVEPRRVGLLVAELPQQPDRAPQRWPATAMRTRRTGWARGRPYRCPRRDAASVSAMTDAGAAGREARRLPELARHPQPRGWRRRALPGEDRRRAGRPRAARSPSSAPPTRPRRPTRSSTASASSGAAPSSRVYAQGMAALRRGDLGEPDVVVDVQNGLPFFSRLVTRKPVVVLVHHVHREQWPVVYPGLPGRIGWWIERRLAPWLYRRCQYVAVSRATRTELRELGVTRPAGRRGPQRHRPGARRSTSGKSPHPDDRRGRTAGAAQAGRARHRRGARAARRVPGPAAPRRGQRLVGGQRCTSTPRSAAPARPWSSRGTSTSSASTRSTSRRGCSRCPR